MSQGVRNVTAVITRLLFPATCIGCGAATDPICGSCAERCAPPPVATPPPGVDAWAAAFAYEGIARELVARLKYRNERHALEWLARATAVAARDLTLPTVIAWVPTTRARKQARGFDHAELLARAVARALHVPVRRLLRRTDATPQTGRSAAERRAGPRFAARLVPRGSTRTAMLVDDVATTGATLAAAAAALRCVGFESIEAVTVARTAAIRR